MLTQFPVSKFSQFGHYMGESFRIPHNRKLMDVLPALNRFITGGGKELQGLVDAFALQG
jgi:hypothetical protein